MNLPPVYAVRSFLRTTDLDFDHPLRQRLGGSRERVAAFLHFAHAHYLAAGWGRPRLRGVVLVGEPLVSRWEQTVERTR